MSSTTLPSDTDAAAPPERTATAGIRPDSAEGLVETVQALSRARDLETVMEIVRHAARELTGADGATFVLRDGDQCHYAEENAIAPLWKGRRFPMDICISGWAMLNREAAVIEDIYADPRIPAAAYRPTFVKSLVMVPIRTEDPIGAIGNYWATRRRPTEKEVALLQMLANFTATAMANIALYDSLQDKVKALESANAELDAFAWAASHDLKAPLRAIDYLANRIDRDIEAGEPGAARARLDTLRQRAARMGRLLASMRDYAGAGADPSAGRVEIADGATIAEDLRLLTDLPAGFDLAFAPGFAAIRLPRVPAQRVFGNLVENAVRHHDRETGRIEIGLAEEETRYVFTVRDDGPGIAPQYREKAFEMFQTLQPRDETEGSGMGLALVRKTLAALGGQIAIADAPTARDARHADRGTAFRILWPKPLDYADPD